MKADAQPSEPFAYYLADGAGDAVDSPSSSDIREMLMALDLDDEEHGEVWLEHTENQDAISWLVDGRLQLRRPHGTLRTLLDVTRERAVDYFRLFEAGNLAALDALPLASR